MELTWGLAGKRVLVTGGSRGIGAEVAALMAAAGARVVACHRDSSGTAPASGTEGGAGDGAAAPYEMVTADVTSPADVRELIATCADRLGGLDILVNNAGVDGAAPIAKLTPDEWHQIIDANVTSTYLVTRQALTVLADGGSIVNLGASVALRGRPAAAHYTASKAAIIGLTRSLARELGPRGIRVNTVAPGVIDPGRPGAGPPPEVRARLESMTALGRLGTRADVAAAVLFLAGDVSQYITGTTLNVDGGM